MIYFILIAVPILDVLWFGWAWYRVRHLPNAKALRIAAALFFALMIGHYCWLLLNRRMHVGPGAPALTLGMAYLWHLIVLPVLSVVVLWAEGIIAGGKFIKGLLRRKFRTQQSDMAPSPAAHTATSGVSRRDFLIASAIVAPPALTIAAGIGGYVQCQNFRITRMDVDMPGLPLQLDGATIAHITDVHTGRFTNEKMLAKIAAATNDLRADVILMTGDLIDYSLSVLPSALDYMAKLDSPGGVYLCEGNHDLFESRTEFERQVRGSGLDILINQSRSIKLRGHDVQLHGLRWGALEGNLHGYRRDGGAPANLEIIAPHIDPEAFSILLAHHPHAFDTAAAMGIPLTLAGHTHGGQLMLTDTIGAGPLMFKYWSGLYRQGASRLVVSNGVGNWFPVRTHAPAEISLLRLRSTALA